MLKRIWLAPPLAFARVGGSPIPCCAFVWSADDLTPDGTAQTTLQIAETIDLDADGIPTRANPDRIIFRDADGIRPVCPYFELHGTWSEGRRDVSGPVTKTVLDRCGIRLSDIRWEVHCAQLKAFHYTYDDGDRIDARLRLRGDDTARHALEGRSPATAKNPLVPKRTFVPLGAVQIAQLTDEYPDVRLRFYAPPGHVYGPTDIDQRIRRSNPRLGDDNENRQWRELNLPAERKILNPRSRWATYNLDRSKLGPFSPDDSRNYPALLFAFVLVEGSDPTNPDHRSLGIVDDISDGLITCSVRWKGRTLSAVARIVVGPPDFGPTSRPPVSLADNLADRADRDAARHPDAWTLDELRDIVGDIFERAFETSDLVNKDYQNTRCHWENADRLDEAGRTSTYDLDEVEAMLWPDITTAANLAAVRSGKASAFHLSEGGERKHRRYATVEYLELRFREDPNLFETWIRRPLDPNPYFDHRMPALMRGSDTRPWHLTRRQWELVRMWVDKLQEATATGDSSTDTPLRPER
jgi:hypothetical protein